MEPTFEYRLPESWAPHQIVHDSIVADGIRVFRLGIATRAPNGEEITGAAAELAEPPLGRGYFELLERVSTLEAMTSDHPLSLRDESGKVTGFREAGEIFRENPDPAHWRFARSNGVAIHDSWTRACERAFFELVERDRVLRAWYGQTRPRRIGIDAGSWLARLSSYDVHAYSFAPAYDRSWDAGVEVVGIFGFPRCEQLPLLLGYGARSTVEEAFTAAARESLQALGFLWGEDLPSNPPAIGPTSAAHAEVLLYPGRQAALRAWLEQGHQMFARPTEATPDVHRTTFVDLTPAWLDGLHVAKAISPNATPLAFGESPFVQHLPTDLHAHPIP